MDIIKKIQENNHAFVHNDNFKGVKKVVVDNYSDQAHFIYELLQNADDVSATAIKFILEKEKMIVRHNGKPFTEANVDAICSISKGTKADDYTKIGRFGIGFKSVFAYTNNPHIYSRNFNFQIEELVMPKRVRNKLVEPEAKETVFVLPFNNPKTKDIAFEQINEKLLEVSTDALLFLSHIVKIEIEVDGNIRKIECSVLQTEKFLKDRVHEETRITITENGKCTSINNYFLFRKHNITLTDTDDNGTPVLVNNQSVMIAFIKQEGMPVPFSQTKNFQNRREGENCLYVFFPTMIHTNFEFLIHAPFVTKSSRDTIAQNNVANTQLMKEIGTLAADSFLIFSKIRSEKMKAVMNQLYFTHFNEGTIRESFKIELISLLKKGYSLVPCDDSKWYGYTAIIFTEEEPALVTQILSLFEKEYLASLCKINKPEIGLCTYDRDNLYYAFLKSALRLKNWNMKILLENLTTDELQKHSTFWFIQFISLLVKKDKYYNTYRLKYEGLDKLPLIRLADGRFVTANEADHVYLNDGSLYKGLLTSPEIRYLYKDIFHIGEYSVERDEAEVALTEIKKERKSDSFVKHKEYLKKVRIAVQAGKFQKEELENQAFLYALNAKTGTRKLVSPKDARIWIWSKYGHGQDIDMKVLLAGVDVWILDERYKDVFGPEDMRMLGAVDGLSVIEVSNIMDPLKNAAYKEAIGLDPEVYIRPHPKHAQNRQFRPYFHIEYLDEILSLKTNIKKSIEILKLVRNYETQIRDIVEWSSNKYYNSNAKIYGSGEIYSAFGLALKTSPWLCNRSYHSCEPGQITEKNLPNEYRKLGSTAIDFLKRLGLKEDKEEEIRKLNEELKRKGMFVIPLAEQQAFAEYQRAKAEKKVKDEERKRKVEQKKEEPDSSENASTFPSSTVVQDILERKKNKVNQKKSDKQRTERSAEETATVAYEQERRRRKQQENQIDEDEYLPRSVDYAKILEKAIQDSAEELERLEKIDALQKRLSESEKYSYGWFTTLLEMELEAAVTNNSDNHEISITFSKVELEPASKRTLLLKNPSRFIPQFVEELSDIPLMLKYEDQTRKVIIEAASVSSYTLRVKLREDINQAELNISGIKEAYLEAQSPAFLMQELQKQFLQLNYEDTYSMRDNLCENIEFVFGPPGTGKTTHLAKNVILPLVQQKEAARILVLTPTNKASDVLVRRIMSLCDPKESFDWLIRFGGTNDEIIEEKGILKEKEIDVRKMQHSVTVTTIARFAYDYFMPVQERLYLYAINWDYVIIDEASMIPLANILYPLYKKSPKQFIIAGDPFQIEPITAVELWKKENIYTMVGLDSFSESKTVPHDYKITKLMTQYRSLPEIGNIFSRFAYDGLLKHYRSSDSRTILNLEQDFSPLNIIKFPVSKYESIYCAKRLQKRSAYQVYSALFSFEFARYLADQLETANPGKCFRIGIIAPYRAESDIIQKLVAAEIHNKNVDVQVGTIHGFQGDECDIIIAVFNTPPYISSSPDMFLNKMNIINVSISRAKDYMFVIMPDEQTENIKNLRLVKRVEKLFIAEGCSIIQAEDMEQQMFGEKKYIEENSFSTGHQDVNVYGLPERRYEVRTEEGAVDIQVHKANNQQKG